VRFASGGTKEAATAQPRTNDLKIGSKPLYVKRQGDDPVVLAAEAEGRTRRAEIVRALERSSLGL